MTNPPSTNFKPVSKAELEQKFDEMWERALKNITPRIPMRLPANPTLGHPPGSWSLLCIFVDANQDEVALADKFLSSSGQALGGRVHHPIRVKVDGVWWHAKP